MAGRVEPESHEALSERWEGQQCAMQGTWRSEQSKRCPGSSPKGGGQQQRPRRHDLTMTTCPAQPNPTKPNQAQPTPVLPCPALPCPALPSPAQPCPALPRPAQARPAPPYPAQPSPAMPFPALPWLSDNQARGGAICHRDMPHLIWLQLLAPMTPRAPAIGRLGDTMMAPRQTCQDLLQQRRT